MNNEMANIALNQLTNSNNGGNRLVAMIGAKNFVRDERNYTIGFKFAAKAKNKANYCRIKLNSMDLYDVEFISIRGVNVKTISNHNDLYADMLKNVFETETGLYLSL
ncbi:MAG: hypothetical protein BWY30_01179 [Tenericutes bacterium ADurb.Bin239]|nr:MAG: hypothetical protein BWY30_01179 [Tenericutes bacterium ADurb.Bin239]